MSNYFSATFFRCEEKLFENEEAILILLLISTVISYAIYVEINNNYYRLLYFCMLFCMNFREFHWHKGENWV